MPFKKCSVRESADDLSIIDDIWVTKKNNLKFMNGANVADFEYTCERNFNKSDNIPPN